MDVIPPPPPPHHHEEARQTLPSPPSELGSSSPLSSAQEQDDTIKPLLQGGGASSLPVKKLPARVRSPSKALLEKMAEAEGSSAHPIKSAHPAAASFSVDVNMKEANSPQAPPSPSSTLPSHSVPSYIEEEPPSDDPDSSSDEDSEHKPKPPRPVTYDRHGIARPRPSYYFDADYDPASDHSKKHGRRGGFKGIPVFEPTMEEFEGAGGFYGFVGRIEKYGMRSGVAKVVPPKEWTNTLVSTVDPLKDIRLREPIEQHMVGSQGLYRVTNVAKTRIWNPAQWKLMSEEAKWASPDFLGERKLGERSERSTKGVGVRGAARKRGRKAQEEEDEDEGQDADVEENAAIDTDVKMEEVSPPAEPTASTSAPTTASPAPTPAPYPLRHLSPSKQAANPSSGSTSGSPPGAKITTPLRKKRPTNLQRAEPSLEEWQTFMATFEELPHGMKVEDYTIELLREVERRYWRTLTFGEAPMYGADMKGSLFDDSTKAWNVAHLGDLLPRLAPKSCKIPGVVSPYLYFGMWRATFAWHVEDADLYSINYIHFGAPKFWYAVPQELAQKFERTMEGNFPTDRSACPQFLRHKSFLASPRTLANAGIILNRVVQLPGEFILTYPKGYHSGFNLGFNCAESINFATERWLPLGRVAKACSCIGDSVNINVDAWLQDAADAEAAQDDADPDSAEAIARRKRKRAHYVEPSTEKEKEKETVEPVVKRKRSKPNKLVATIPAVVKVEVVVEIPAPKISKKAQKYMDLVAKTDSFVCALCPDMSTDGLVRIGEPGVKSRKDISAHRVCVMFTPATWIEMDPESQEELVRGFAKIEKARWKLKCQLCTEKHGCKVQCTKGKCPKAFHATCALQQDSGIYLDAAINEAGADVSILEQARAELDAAKDSTLPSVAKSAIPEQRNPTAPASANIITEPFNPFAVPVPEGEPTASEGDQAQIQLTVLCRTHNPAFQALENVRKAAELLEKINAIPIGSRIRVRTSNGVFEVNMGEVKAEEEIVSFAFDDGKLGEIRFRGIVWPDTPEIARKKEEAILKARAEEVYVYEGHKTLQPTKRSLAAIIAPAITPRAATVPLVQYRANNAEQSTRFPPQVKAEYPEQPSSSRGTPIPQQSQRTCEPQPQRYLPPQHNQRSSAPFQYSSVTQSTQRQQSYNYQPQGQHSYTQPQYQMRTQYSQQQTTRWPISNPYGDSTLSSNMNQSTTPFPVNYPQPHRAPHSQFSSNSSPATPYHQYSNNYSYPPQQQQQPQYQPPQYPQHAPTLPSISNLLDRNAYRGDSSSQPSYYAEGAMRREGY